MEKTIYFCNQCSSTFSEEPGKRLSCIKCGNSLVDTGMDVNEWRALSEAEKDEKRNEFKKTLETSDKGNTKTNGSSVGSLIKTLSMIVGGLGAFGGLVIIKTSPSIGLAVTIVDLLFCVLAYGIGEICDQLTEINRKLK